MSIQISPALTMRDQYNLVHKWDGDMIVRTVHHGDIPVPAGEVAEITEVGLLISWRGESPNGRFLPWGEITSIEQGTVPE